MDNIILIGMPGVGKSTLGVVLAKVLNYQFLDADLLIQQDQGQTLQALIDTYGNDAFIAIENDVLKTIKPATPTIIATGGSAIYSDEAMEYLGALGKRVYLEISAEELALRLPDFEDRGVVRKNGTGMSLHDILQERLPLYEKYADMTISVGGLTITEATRKTAAALRNT